MHSKTLSNAKRLRKEMTPQEKHLWYDFLKAHKYHWYKQRPVGPYILDFYCATAKIAVELDGGQHYSSDGLEYDDKRTKYLRDNGIRVIRIINPDVDRNFEAVCRMIDEEIKEALPTEGP